MKSSANYSFALEIWDFYGICWTKLHMYKQVNRILLLAYFIISVYIPLKIKNWNKAINKSGKKFPPGRRHLLCRLVTPISPMFFCVQIFFAIFLRDFWSEWIFVWCASMCKFSQIITVRFCFVNNFMRIEINVFT